MFLINGQQAEVLPISDRGLQFGDGCFTTARIRSGQVVMLNRHLKRLKAACERLFINFSQWELLADEMRQVALNHNEAVLKVIITRGSGGRGYSGMGCNTPTRVVSVSSYPAQYARWREQGIVLTLSPVHLGRNPSLAGLKHLNRLEQVLIRSHLEQTDADEALVLDSDGWLTECCAANVFWRKGSQVFTPRLDQAGVNGIMRQHCMDMLARSPFGVVEVSVRPDALRDADEVLICNALMPLVPARGWDDICWSERELYHFLAPLCELPG
ncbi:TPA: aminodeoxychorismate lyase [Klebsiella aerogenes]|uniref:aminodeoxychorismate lyase n=1 Tax=Klebsiella aerogenes TaxID=548 RepID=UPI0007B33BED|nr:aminodeoxychorismate lyase [Klebsiella aerogenes]ELA1690243.1 aminodeoxychorismate lyase [Klebsiella aerogenes]ELW9546640.1 aminodeoxychorismate lyase [Klebsiella aerogenes]KZR18741.1 aminodeoxychorismate lyase [Klebsiella aerogenes]QDR56602.1 aminodeoxychorismate lyase [Klebsiella aerogenes]TSI53261.1 aminodeoxychorismate lyase [Klebsiella aerogenes]